MARKPAQGQSPRSSTPKTAQHEQGPVPWPTPPRLSAAINSNKSVYSAPESAYDFKLPETPNDTPSIALPRDEPLTPKSPTSTVTAFTSQTILARSAANANDVEAVNELLQTMKLTLGALGATFDTLGEQTMRVAELGPAIDANHQISLVRRQLDDQHKRQEQRMQDVKATLKSEFKDGKLQERLQEVAATIVREIVRKEVAQRVRKQLQEQVTLAMKEQVIQYQRQILEVKLCLHNSEARRHNSFIRTNSLEEPLLPLLRPLPPPIIPSTPLSGNTIVPSASTIDPVGAPATPPREPVSLTELRRAPPVILRLPTPSPLFPRDLPSLMRLETEDVRSLVLDYGLILSYEGGAGRKEVECSREDLLNRFLSYIGVGFQLVSGSAPSPGAATPLVRSRSEAVGVL